MVEVKKVIRTKLFGLTTTKQKALDGLWNEWKSALKIKGGYKVLRKQTMLHSHYCRAIDWKVGGDSPVLIDKDTFRLVDTNNAYARWFVRIPTPSGKIWCPLRMQKEYEDLLNHVEVCDSTIVKKHNDFYFHITIKKEVQQHSTNPIILSIDIGERVLATSVALNFNTSTISSPMFYGRQVRGIRRHYAWLRKRLSERKKFKAVKQIGNTEHRKVNDVLHKISKDIVRQAKQLNATIVIGMLSGIRERARRKGRRFNRIVNAMPFNKLSQFIEYKAMNEGIPVVYANEAYTSITCHVCNNVGTRPAQGLFKCHVCGLEYNADLNGAINIGKRFSDHWLLDGAVGLQPMREAVNSEQTSERSTSSQVVF